MDANIKITYDESALVRVYLWLLSLKDPSPAGDGSGAENVVEVDSIVAAQASSNNAAPEEG